MKGEGRKGGKIRLLSAKERGAGGERGAKAARGGEDPL